MKDYREQYCQRMCEKMNLEQGRNLTITVGTNSTYTLKQNNIVMLNTDINTLYLSLLSIYR